MRSKVIKRNLLSHAKNAKKTWCDYRCQKKIMKRLVQTSETKKKASSVAYSIGFLLVLGFVAQSYLPKPAFINNSSIETQSVSAKIEAPASVASNKTLVASKTNDIAVAATIAETAALPVATEVAIASTVATAEEEIAQTTKTVVDKPTIVDIDQATTGIQSHKVKSGDKLSQLAAQYGVTEQTIRWANDIKAGSEPVADTVIKIPPVDGVLYKVKPEDAVDQLADKYDTSAQRIITYNNLESSNKLVADQEIIIPGGVLPENERPDYEPPVPVVTAPTVAPSRTPAYSSYNSYSAYGGGGRVGLTTIGYGGGASAGNRYAYGNCTWYSYERRLKLGRPIGGLWGNATSWASSATSNGFAVNKTPAPGAIFQNHGGYGHVGIVEKVYPNGDIYVTEMNYQGYNVISGATIQAAYVGNYNYIH